VRRVTDVTLSTRGYFAAPAAAPEIAAALRDKGYSVTIDDILSRLPTGWIALEAVSIFIGSATGGAAISRAVSDIYDALKSKLFTKTDQTEENKDETRPLEINIYGHDGLIDSLRVEVIIEGKNYKDSGENLTLDLMSCQPRARTRRKPRTSTGNQATRKPALIRKAAVGLSV
jgi:hypothetical protein